MKRNIITMMVLVMTVLLVIPADAQRKKKKKGEEEAPKKEEKKEDTLEDKTKSSKKIDGLFTIYQDSTTGSVQIYIKDDQLDKEYIYQSFSMGGPPQLFLNQNMLRETWLFKIRKNYDKLEFVRSNTNFYFDPENALSKAADADISEAVFYSVKPELDDSTGYLIKMDGLLISEKLDQVKPTLPPGFPPTAILNLGSLKKDKSSYLKLRSYPNNTDFVVNMAYENPRPLNYGDGTVTDPRYINVKMQHSFLEIPESDFKPRYDDPRVGYFTNEVTDMTDYSTTPYRDVINRWNLVKKDPNAELSEPVEPIVWWVENTTPVEWRETILEAGRKWNEAFEAAGFKNAVVMKMMPDDAEWDPADIRYNVIRWVSSNLGFAIGPSFVNPRTGQILGADITIDFWIMGGANAEADIFEAFTNPEFMSKHAMCTIGKGKSMQYSMATAVLEASLADAADLDKLRHQFMTELVLHEMGHTMGLNHNMKASNMLTVEELADQSITREKGVMGSVMDYSAPNLIMQDEPVDYYTTKVGPYDVWAIQYGYSTYENEEDEAEGLNAILSRSHEPDLIFGNDADIVFPGRGIDPRVRTWDMGQDVLKFNEMQFKLVNETMGKMRDKFVKEGESYQNLRSKYNSLRWQRNAMATSSVTQIGGIYVDRSFPEQESGNKPFTPVSEDHQREAMRLLTKYVFAPDAFDADAELFPYLQMQRRGFNFFSGTEDPDPQSYVSGMHNSVFFFLFYPSTLERMNNTSLYGNTYSITEMMRDLRSAVFDADISGSVNLYRQNAQNMLVDRLISVVEADSRYDYASRSASYATLKDLRSRLNRASNTGNSQTRAHRSHLVYKIDKALSTD